MTQVMEQVAEIVELLVVMVEQEVKEVQIQALVLRVMVVRVVMDMMWVE